MGTQDLNEPTDFESLLQESDEVDTASDSATNEDQDDDSEEEVVEDDQDDDSEEEVVEDDQDEDSEEEADEADPEEVEELTPEQIAQNKKTAIKEKKAEKAKKRWGRLTTALNEKQNEIDELKKAAALPATNLNAQIPGAIANPVAGHVQPAGQPLTAEQLGLPVVIGGQIVERPNPSLYGSPQAFEAAVISYMTAEQRAIISAGYNPNQVMAPATNEAAATPAADSADLTKLKLEISKVFEKDETFKKAYIAAQPFFKMGSTELNDLIMESPDRLKILKKLSVNPDLILALNDEKKKSTTSLTRAFIALEKSVKGKKQTKAPKPGKRRTGGKSVVKGKKNPQSFAKKSSNAEWAEFMNS